MPHETAAAQTRAPRGVHLRGRNHPALGEVVVEALSPAVAVGLTRGGRDKRYAYTDPNEDVVAAVAGERTTLVAVADGHNGRDASEAAVEVVLEMLGDPPPDGVADDELIDLFVVANHAVQRRTSRPDAVNTSSRTTLAVAIVTDRLVQWASFGDSAVLVASPRSGRQLNSPRPWFLGYPLVRSELGQLLDRGRYEPAPGEWIVLATDGFSDFAHPAHLAPAEIVSIALEGRGDATRITHRLIQQAIEGGAGDNVGVAVAAARPPAR